MLEIERPRDQFIYYRSAFHYTNSELILTCREVKFIKATKVDGVYDKDPLIYEDAVRFDHLTYMEAINKRLKVMDSTALSLCMDNDLPILVLNLWDSDALRSALYGEKVGTLVSD